MRDRRPPARRRGALLPAGLCSVPVLAALGLLTLTLPAFAQGAGGTLTAGTLPVLRGVVAGKATVARSAPGTRPELTVQQDSQRAIIDWKSFNISADSAVRFNQPSTTALALNRIYGTDPTVIQGQLSANGQLILINQNGILFDRGASVNVQSLIASTLNLKMSNDDFCGKNLATCASGQALSAGGLSSEAFGGGYNDDGTSTSNGKRPNNQPPGTISLGSFGPASAAAPQLQAAQGGSIMLFAPRIDNNGGIIRAPDGQVVLAAGQKVYLGISDDSSDTTLRGFVVEVEAVTDDVRLDLTNLVRNAGDISADRGNVTLAGLTVNQEGRVSAKTAVQANGSIYLKARSVGKADPTKDATVANGQAGSVNFAKGSVTEVMPDAADTATVSDSTAYTTFRGVVDVRGGVIEQHGTVQAAGGVINLVASNAAQPTAARVYLDADSLTSVAGNWADVDFTKNIVTFRVTSNELKDSPDQKNGLLRGATVTVDLRQGSNILDLSGYRDTVVRTVAEKAAVGGSMVISSEGDVIQRSGAVLDASGGGYRYNGGSAMISRLLGADGKIYDIANAPEALLYLAQLDRYERTDSRWGKTVSIANPLGAVATYESGYVEGKAGGDITIVAKAGLALDGAMKGGVTVGTKQAAAAPRGATLTLGDSETAGRITRELVFRNTAADTLGSGFGVHSALGASQAATFTLAADQLFASGEDTAQGRVEHAFGSVNVYLAADASGVGGGLSLPQDVTLRSEPGAALNLNASALDLAGDIFLPGGALTLSSILSIRAAGNGAVVHSTSTLSTAGAWLNLYEPAGGPQRVTGRQQADGSTRSVAQGGSLTLGVGDSRLSTIVERGALLDVSGGGIVRADKSVAGGAGGALSVATGVDGQTTSDWLQGELRGFGSGTSISAAGGGSLSLAMGSVLIDSAGAHGVLPGRTTLLDTGLFSDQGFAKISVTAAGSLVIAPDTDLLVEQKTRIFDADNVLFAPSGSSVEALSSVQRLPDWQRAAASVSLTASGRTDTLGTLTLSKGAAINADPRASVSLKAADGMDVWGRITALGGTVALSVSASPAALAQSPLRLAAGSEVNVAGTFIAKPGDKGLVQGSLIDGGSVTLSGVNAGVVAEAGSLIDLHGVAQTVDATVNSAAPSGYRKTLEGSAGTLSIHTEGEFVLDASLQASAGGATGAGGSFALESQRPGVRGEPLPDERRIVATTTGNAVAPVAGAVDAVVNTARLQASGFDKLRLQSENRIAFDGNAALTFTRGLRLDAPALEVADGAVVQLRSTTVALGQSWGQRVQSDPGDPRTSVWTLDNAKAVPAVATRGGTGTLSVDAGWVDVFGALTINGTALTRIRSDADVRLVGRSVSYNDPTTNKLVTGQIGSLTSAGNLELDAAQVYASTLSDFTLAVKDSATNHSVPGGYIRISESGQTAGAVYSAASKLTLQADNLVQEGRLLAPLGQIALNGGSRVTLGAGSLTSVSADGLTIPLGTTTAGTQWTYFDGSSGVALSAVGSSGKTISIGTPSLTVRPGATVDLSGGGNVLAAEFVKGNGGSHDITVEAANTYAIVPTGALAASPYDTYIQSLKDIGSGFSVTANRDAARYDSITIGAGGAVAAGNYVLLPARYALLPGAYLVELQTGSTWSNLQLGQTAALANGETVVAGFRSARGTSVRDPSSVGVVVRSGQTAVKKSSDFTLSGAEFFAAVAEKSRSTAPAAPWDGGRLVLQGLESLSVDGSFKTAAATNTTYGQGREAEVDITGSAIAIVGSAASSVPEGTLKIQSQSLNALNASVLLGGTRSTGKDGVTLTTTAGSITVANDAATPVSVPELLLAATGDIDVRAGAVLEAAGSGGATEPVTLVAGPSGALVRLSSGQQATVTRANASTSSGRITIEEGATLRASKSLLLDATQGTTSAGRLSVGGDNGAGGSLAISAAQITLGASTPGTDGLSLTDSVLASFSALDEFIVRGHTAIDVAGSVNFGSDTLAQLTLDTPLLRGVATGGEASAAVIAARNLTLQNSGSEQAVAATGEGTLTFKAQTLTLGAGEKAISGYASTLLAASDRVTFSQTGALRAAGDLTLQAPLLQAKAGATQMVSAEDNHSAGAIVRGRLAVTGGQGGSGAGQAAELGGRLTLQGSSVAIDSTVQARSGVINVQALGTGASDGVVLGANGRLDARGEAVDFYGTSALTDGGTVTLSAALGGVSLAAGSAVDVSAAGEGGNAGRLEIQTAGVLSAAGTLSGSAGLGATSGTAVLDVGGLADFSSLNRALNSGGYGAERDLRLRTGSLTVGAEDQVAAEKVTLSVDQGALTVLGQVGSGAAAGGGRVELYAGADVRLAAGSRIAAGTSAEGGKGGEVRVASSGGGVSFEAGAVIDLRAGTGGMPGGVVFGVQRDAADQLAPLSLQGQVLRGGGVAAASVDVEATRRYDLTGRALDQDQIGALANDHAAFIAAADGAGLGAALTAGLTDENGRITDARLLGATEVVNTDAAAALVVSSAINLTDASTWYSGQRPGTLTLRSAGDLIVQRSVGDGDSSVQSGDTWSLRLSAGADVLAANPLATVSGAAGALVLSSGGDIVNEAGDSVHLGARLRTGTGRIDLAAAGDIRIDDAAAAVYTAGRIGAADALNTSSVTYNRWTIDGGGISLRAGGRIIGSPESVNSVWVNDWLRRNAGNPPTTVGPTYRTEWWAYRAGFRQGVGSFGGGNIDVQAGGNVERLALALPSSGRTVYVGDVRDVDVQGGGNLSLRVGGDLVGGDIVLGRGTGTVAVAGEAGAGRGVQLWMLGLNGLNEGQVQTRLDLSAGGGATLQSVNNPTALYLSAYPDNRPHDENLTPDPSIRQGTVASSFFTYGADTALAVTAKGGDVVYNYRAAGSDSVQTNIDQQEIVAAIVTPRFALAALGGSVLAGSDFLNDDPDVAVYPSRQSRLSLLAKDSIPLFPLVVSDLDPSLVVTPLTPKTPAGNTAYGGTRAQLAGDIGRLGDNGVVLPGTTKTRIVERTETDVSPPFEVLTLEGDITGAKDALYLPAASRIIAGRDVVQANLTLQNLSEDAVSIVRAVQGDIRAPQQMSIQGPGRLVLQAGRDIDLGGITGLSATGNTVNTQLPSTQSARLTLLAGVSGDVDLAKLDGDSGVYQSLISLNSRSSAIVNLFNQLALEGNAQTILDAKSIADLAAGDSAYGQYVVLDSKAPQALAAYQRALRENLLPLASSGDVAAVAALYAQLNLEPDVKKLQAASSLAALAQQQGGGAYAGYLALAEKYPVLYSDYVQRRAQGATPTSVMPVLFSMALADIVAQAIPVSSVSAGGDISTYLTAVQTFGGSAIDLLAPAGKITVGLTTAPANDKAIGILTNAGGGISAISKGNFDINLGKVITVQGGDILLYSSGGSIDAGRGAKTSQTTPSPKRTVTKDPDGNVKVTVSIPGTALGSGIQTLTSDPDGLGPLTAPDPGSVYLFAPAGTIDAGEAGIKSSGSLVLNAQAVLNASNISAAGPTTGVPVVQTGSLAASLATGGTTTTPAKAAEDAAKQASEAARNAAAAAQAPKPTLLSVEVMGFGEKNCREDDKDCLGK